MPTMHNGNPRQRGVKWKGTGRIFEETLDKNIPKRAANKIYTFRKYYELQNRIKSKRSTLIHIRVKLSKDKGSENLAPSKKESTCHIKEILNKINKQFLFRDVGGQKTLG